MSDSGGAWAQAPFDNATIEPLQAILGRLDTGQRLWLSGYLAGTAAHAVQPAPLVGKAPGRYNPYLGASAAGERMNTPFRENFTEQQILGELRPLLQRYAAGRTSAESFGDFGIRTGVVPAMLAGRDFQK